MNTAQVHGRCRWIAKPVALPSEDWAGILEITSYTYRGQLSHKYLVTKTDAGYRLECEDGEVYDIDLEWGWDQAECSCSSHTYRSRTCRHAKALHAALQSLNLAQTDSKTRQCQLQGTER
jgi:hypothetical protein